MDILTDDLTNKGLIINRSFKKIFLLNNLLDPERIWLIKDEPVKKVLKERTTGRFFLKNSNEEYIEFYIKRYSPTSIKNRIRDIFSLKWKCFDAYNEWNALLKFHKNQLPTLIPVLVGKIDKKTFLITLGLKGYCRASDLLEKERGLDDDRRKRIIANIAFYAAKMHKCGFAHQDLYLVHFFIKGKEDTPYLIDLQRVIFQKALRRRWVVKDLAQLLFSSRLVLDDDEITFLLDQYCYFIGFDIREDKRLFSAIEKKAQKIMRRYKRSNN